MLRSLLILFGKRTAWIAALMLCPLLHGQSNEGLRDGQNNSPRDRSTGLSELAKENLNRVAASSVQIREVLVKDAGLLVELKRWVAKEAADNGQVVEDSNLSDQAIFDRLDHDVAFRSVATRLVQRYGYLQPAPNPESSFAKEEDLVLKERARRLVQIEAQEDNEALAQKKNDQQQEELERTSTCNSEQDVDCERTGSRGRSPNRPRQNQQPDNEPFIPNTNPPYLPDMPSSPISPRMFRTDNSSDGLGLRDQQPSGAMLEMASSSSRLGADSAFRSEE